MLDEPQLEAIRQLLHLAESYHLSQLEVESDGLQVTIRTRGPAPCHPPEPDSQSGAAPAHAVGEPASRAAAPDHHPLLSPMTGTFYIAPSPDESPFDEVGQHVEEGQPLGVIESMKVFSTVPSDRDGRVVRICKSNAELVHEGEVLVLLESAA